MTICVSLSLKMPVHPHSLFVYGIICFLLLLICMVCVLIYFCIHICIWLAPISLLILYIFLLVIFSYRSFQPYEQDCEGWEMEIKISVACQRPHCSFGPDGMWRGFWILRKRIRNHLDFFWNISVQRTGLPGKEPWVWAPCCLAQHLDLRLTAIFTGLCFGGVRIKDVARMVSRVSSSYLQLGYSAVTLTSVCDRVSSDSIEISTTLKSAWHLGSITPFPTFSSVSSSVHFP